MMVIEYNNGDMRRKILAGLLYGLPMLFFVVAYFGITASGEDIYQGAGNYSNGTQIDVVSDAGEAFSHNGRVTDVYAWTVIDFFDYQFKFGPDVVFRLLDVLMAGGIFYVISLIVLNRRPQLKIRDALVFDTIFLMVILTQHGRVFYAGFSAIHNYMIAIFIMLLFLLPYILKMRGWKLEKMNSVWAVIGLLILGVIFGMSAAITPIAFLIIALIYGDVLWMKKKKRPPFWGIIGALGVVIGVLCSNFLGPSLDFYTSNDIYISAYDYISVSGFLADPLNGFATVMKHEVSNFGRVILPLIIFVIIGLVSSRKSWELFKKKTWQKMDSKKKRILALGGVFMAVNILGASQVNAPIRILLPAYVVGVMTVAMIFEPYVKVKVFGWAVGIIALGLVAAKIGLTINYHGKMSEVLEEIRQSDQDTMCVEQVNIKAYNFPVVYLGQEDMLADWAMPENIYGKKIEFCK